MADHKKTIAIQEMQTPTNISELRQFTGTINQKNKFTPKLSILTKPLRELLSFSGAQAKSRHSDLQKRKSLTHYDLQNDPLVIYDQKKDLKVSADASSYGLGSCRKKGSDRKPVSFASCSMSETECRYAQIE